MSITNVTGDNYGRFQGNPTIANIAIIGQSFQFRKTPYIGYILYVTQYTYIKANDGRAQKNLF